MAFLFALGMVYGIAYACVNNVLVLWPLLIPLGSFYNSLQSGEIDLPWASIAGFVDVMAIMFAAVWFAHRRERRDGPAAAGETTEGGRPDVRLTR
jgi:hypothetical protein